MATVQLLVALKGFIGKAPLSIFFPKRNPLLKLSSECLGGEGDGVVPGWSSPLTVKSHQVAGMICSAVEQ